MHDEMADSIIVISEDEDANYDVGDVILEKFVQDKKADDIVLVWPFKIHEEKEFGLKTVTIVNNLSNRLKRRKMLDDELVNFGISYFSKLLCPDEQKRSNVYIFSTFGTFQKSIEI